MGTLSAAAPARGQCELQNLLASDGAAGDLFGVALSVSDDLAVIGAYGNDDLGDYSGAAYTFGFDGQTWTEQAKLLAEDGAVEDLFGWSVSIAGSVAIIGAWGDDDQGTDSGSAYVFRREGDAWIQEAKLLAPDGSSGDSFGFSVAIDADVAVVGAVNGANTMGAAYVFGYVNAQWEYEATLLASDGRFQDAFGISVAIAGDVAVVGAQQTGGWGRYSGSAYVFRKSGRRWREEAKLEASDGKPNELLGRTVAVQGDMVLVGAPVWSEHPDPGPGSVYAFRFDGNRWTEIQKLVAPDGAPLDRFGISVDLDQDRALIGAYLDGDNGFWAGSAYVFEFDGQTWSQQTKLLASDGRSQDFLGYSVSLSGDFAFAGAYNNDDNGMDSGSAYVFNVSDCGLECSGDERIAKATCVEKRGQRQLTIKLAGGAPRDTYHVEITGGQSEDGTLNRKGKGKAKFPDAAPGAGSATVTWGCGAEAIKNYECPP